MSKIIIYSTPSCPYCISAKHFFRERNLSYEERDVSKNPEYIDEMIKKSHQMGVPVIDIDGEIIVGFDRLKLEEIFNEKK